MIQQAKGTENKKDVEDFKQLVSEELTPYASAILLDLEYGTPAIKARHEGSGLLTSYEKTGYDATTPGKLPDLIEDLSDFVLKKMVEMQLKFLFIMIQMSLLKLMKSNMPF